jgi:hypothetical protein
MNKSSEFLRDLIRKSNSLRSFISPRRVLMSFFILSSEESSGVEICASNPSAIALNDSMNSPAKLERFMTS